MQRRRRSTRERRPTLLSLRNGPHIHIQFVHNLTKRKKKEEEEEESKGRGHILDLERKRKGANGFVNVNVNVQQMGGKDGRRRMTMKKMNG